MIGSNRREYTACSSGCILGTINEQGGNPTLICTGDVT